MRFKRPEQYVKPTGFINYRTSLVIAVVLISISIASMRQSNAQSGLVVTTLAGISSPGLSDGTGVTARFNGPLGITIDKDDNIIVADFRNARIRKVTQDGQVTTIAGSSQGFANGYVSYARFYGPAGVAIDKAGNIFVADYANHRIRKIAPDGAVTTIAGSGKYGTMNGSGLAAQFAYPTCVLPARIGATSTSSIQVRA